MADMVMHDLNLTSHVAQHVGFIIDGRIAAAGLPADVMTADRLGQAYGCLVALNKAPDQGTWFLPHGCSMHA